ncbi:uncharacterized protein LOC122757618 [Drosophila mojavensis]|uniref:uncharacterized protein LOC122757618 n=1 Tax=Drosophila mojavensis TaxID=7230 RepID=UPI001CD16783|nr:uncharacterized protein LOC122757618 [Drosophila mojavensis]
MVTLEDLEAEAVERNAHEPIRRNDIRTNSIARWQRRWNSSTNYTLIPELEPWSYLKRFGHDETDECSWCGRGLVEDANHVLFECGRFLEERRCLEEALGRSIKADNMVNVMLESEAAWKLISLLISTFATRIMMELRRIERRAVPS